MSNDVLDRDDDGEEEDPRYEGPNARAERIAREQEALLQIDQRALDDGPPMTIASLLGPRPVDSAPEYWTRIRYARYAVGGQYVNGRWVRTWVEYHEYARDSDGRHVITAFQIEMSRIGDIYVPARATREELAQQMSQWLVLSPIASEEELSHA